MDTSHASSLFRSTVDDESSKASERRNLPQETVLEDYFNTPSPARVLQHDQNEAPEFFTSSIETVEDYLLPEALQPSIYNLVTGHMLQEYTTDATGVPSSHGIKTAASLPPPDFTPPVLLSSLTPSITRYWHLYHRINALLRAIGRFHSSKGSFTRTTHPGCWQTAPLADRRAHSYAAADAAISHAEHSGRRITSADLLLFAELRELSWAMLRQIEVARGVTLRDWAWGAVGLAAGWVGPPTHFLENRKQRLLGCMRAWDAADDWCPKTPRREVYRTGTVLMLHLHANRQHVRSLFVVDVVAAWLRGAGRAEVEEKEEKKERKDEGAVVALGGGGLAVVLQVRPRKDYLVEYAAAAPLPA